MLVWLGRGFPEAEQRIRGLELRFHSMVLGRSRIWGARSEEQEEEEQEEEEEEEEEVFICYRGGEEAAAFFFSGLTLVPVLFWIRDKPS